MEIPYAVLGGMALVVHGYDRTTVDVDILLTSDGLNEVHKKLQGLGYLPPLDGSRDLRDTRSGVQIEFRVTGQHPGDGKSKPVAVAFLDPAEPSVEKGGIRYVRLTHLVARLGNDESRKTQRPCRRAGVDPYSGTDRRFRVKT